MMVIVPPVGRALALLAALAATTAAPAQELLVRQVDGDREVLTLRFAPYPGPSGTGGLGFAFVDAVNQSDEPHAVRLELASRPWSGNNVDLRRTFGLGPRERARFHLPLPEVPNYSCELTVTVDSTRHDEAFQAGSRGPVALLIAESPTLEPEVLGLAQALWPQSRGRTKPVAMTCPLSDAPRDWRLLTAFPLVVVDGHAGIDGELQDALRRFAHAGGRLLVMAPASLPAGALRDLAAELDGTGSVRHGFGVVTAVRSIAAGGARLERELAAAAGSAGIWPLGDAIEDVQRIPGLDQAPVLAFLTVILAFAIVVGPVNFYLLRRAKRPMLALVTVPAIGFGTTLLMFAYAVVHDGFGVRGVERSWSLLDQVDHEVSVLASRTLFAGLSPGPLALGDDGMLLAPAAFARTDNRSRHRWSYDGDTGLLEGVLPARTPTALVSARQGIARERLRARRGGDGGLELLTDGGVEPVGDVLLRDLDGDYWAGRAPRLARVDAAAAFAALQRFRTLAGEFDTVPLPNTIPASPDEVVRAMVADTLAPGCYVTEVARVPWLPDHGLSPAYAGSHHFVLGRLGREDIDQ
ncbi:MAG: hypothetical protein KDE27_07695 [Planctomycetes bacterium]|nr:hypothetical protein [Planctomycetota bacterium]